MSVLIFLTISLLLFVLGYHLGNQYGRTAKIREDLNRARSSRS